MIIHTEVKTLLKSWFQIQIEWNIVWFLWAEEPTRSLSGLLLKNNIRSYYEKFPPNVTEFIKKACLECVGDDSALIRATIGILITTIVGRGGLEQWPDLLYQLDLNLDSNKDSVCEVK